jgi:nucleoside-diphosphate-sugar epimerase
MGQGLHLLLTGASGFVGRALVCRLVAQGHRVTSLVRDAAASAPASGVLVHGLGSGAPLVLPPDVDGVVHLAQSRSYRAFPGDAVEMFAVNVAGAHEVLLAAAAAKVSRFCMVSSGTVYDPFVEPMEEDRLLAPPGNLGATKLASEVLAKPYSALFPVSILRLFAPYGPGQTARLIPDLMGRIRRGEAVTLPSSGGGMRFTPTYVDDICGVLLAAIEESWTGTFNVASQEVLSVEEVARRIGAALGAEPRFERREMNAPSLVPSLTKLGGQYDLSRFRSFADGIAATVASER